MQSFAGCTNVLSAASSSRSSATSCRRFARWRAGRTGSSERIEWIVNAVADEVTQRHRPTDAA
jgi:hypothetical protein